VLAVVLATGNTLNEGSFNGNARGFQIQVRSSRAVLDIFGAILGYGVPFSNRLVNGTFKPGAAVGCASVRKGDDSKAFEDLHLQAKI